MTQLFQLLLIASPVIVLIIILYAIFKKPKKKLIQTTSIFDKYSDRGKIWIKKLWNMYLAGLTWPPSDPNFIYEDYEKTFGVNLSLNNYGTKVSSYWKDIGLSENWNNIEDVNDIEYKKGDFLFWLDLGLYNRWNKQYKPLSEETEAEVMKKYAPYWRKHPLVPCYTNYNIIQRILSPLLARVCSLALCVAYS